MSGYIALEDPGQRRIVMFRKGECPEGKCERIVRGEFERFWGSEDLFEAADRPEAWGSRNSKIPYMERGNHAPPAQRQDYSAKTI